ncbi:unnamed protein product [Closterium sp. Yama58-4]|nr:unnamed protein product [Closterium sp. Yama58-4]
MASGSRKRRFDLTPHANGNILSEAPSEGAIPGSTSTARAGRLEGSAGGPGRARRAAGGTAETAIDLAEEVRDLGETVIDLAETGASHGRKRQVRQAAETSLAISAVHSTPSPSRAVRASRGSRGRAAKPVVEKRLTRFLPHPSRAVLDRIERAYVHRLYLIGFDWPRSPRGTGGGAGSAGGTGRSASVGTVAPGAGGAGNAGLSLTLPPPQSSQSPSSHPIVSPSTLAISSSPTPTLASPPARALSSPHTPSSTPPPATSPLRPCSCNFHVLGATGNVYTVTISQQPSCTCPDYGNGNLCKHMLFVLLRVLRVGEEDPRVWQRSLLSTELNELLDRIDALERRTLAAAAEGEEILASPAVREQFARIAGGAPGSGALGLRDSGSRTEGDSQDAEVGKTDQRPKQRPIEGDCPICYEPLGGEGAGKRGGGKPAETVVFCQRCGNNVHSDCFSRWKAAKRGGMVTCVWCRAPWGDGSTTHTARAHYDRDSDSDGYEDEEGPQEYVNLSQYSEAHRSADASLETLYPDTHMFCSGGRRRLRRQWW